jgi:hypothetical protein
MEVYLEKFYKMIASLKTLVQGAKEMSHVFRFRKRKWLGELEFDVDLGSGFSLAYH